MKKYRIRKETDRSGIETFYVQKRTPASFVELTLPVWEDLREPHVGRWYKIKFHAVEAAKDYVRILIERDNKAKDEDKSKPDEYIYDFD